MFFIWCNDNLLNDDTGKDRGKTVLSIGVLIMMMKRTLKWFVSDERHNYKMVVSSWTCMLLMLMGRKCLVDQNENYENDVPDLIRYPF